MGIPISPSISALGTNAATESTTITSIARCGRGFPQFRGLLAGIRLRHEQVVGVHAQLLGIGQIQRMFGIDERRDATGLLRLGDGMQRQGGFTGRLRSKIFDDRPARESPTPSAISNPNEPLEIAGTSAGRSSVPSFITAPLPYCFSI